MPCSITSCGSNPDRGLTPDPWARLRRFTSARIAMGRAGGSLRTANLLDFRRAHALARDAVLAPFDPGKVETQLRAAALPCVRAATPVRDRLDYLLHPETGRRLAPDSERELRERAREWGARDIAVVISDGLCACAAESHAVAVAAGVRAELPEFSFYPVAVVPFARVKLADAVSEALGARLALILLGERPGLGARDSLSAYFTYMARNSSVDSDRNCVSNIRPGGMPVRWAVRKLSTLIRESLTKRIGGTRLKDMLTLADLARALPLEAGEAT